MKYIGTNVVVTEKILECLHRKWMEYQSIFEINDSEIVYHVFITVEGIVNDGVLPRCLQHSDSQSKHKSRRLEFAMMDDWAPYLILMALKLLS